MKIMRHASKAMVIGFSVVALGFGAISVSAPQASALPPLLCGPTLVWNCTGKFGPDVQFIGTVCDKAAFEQATRRVCVPAPLGK